MTIKKSRLDIPGFSYGERTGEFIDVPRIFGGRPTPKKSGKPHSIVEQIRSETISRAARTLQLATRIAKKDYTNRKRARVREAHRATTNNASIRACNRRFFEHMGLQAGFLAYVEQPELFVSMSKRAYEITDGFLPFVTVTSSREALLIIASLMKYGIATYFNVVKVPF